MGRGTRLLTAVLLAAMTVLSACGKKEERPAAPLKSTSPGAERARPRIVVPESVEGKWKAVKIAVLDKETGGEEVYTVDVGGTFTVADAGISVEVKTFLPAFIMNGTIMTSASNETDNPATQIVIYENEREIFQGWLFSLYPSAHAFQHPRFSFTLVDYVPAEKKG